MIYKHSDKTLYILHFNRDIVKMMSVMIRTSFCYFYILGYGDSLHERFFPYFALDSNLKMLND